MSAATFSQKQPSLILPFNSTPHYPVNEATQAMNNVISGRLKKAKIYFNASSKPHFSVSKIDCEHPTEKKTSDIFLKITPLDSEVQGCKIAFCDSNTPSLKPFDFQFAEQDVYQTDGKTFSILQRLVAPSIGGKEALALIKNTTQTLGIPILYVSDGSLLSTNKCCKESSLISLKLLQIFKYGETWYEKQGAQPTSNFEGVNYKSFQYLNEYLEKFVNLKLYNQDYLESHYLELLKMTQDEINDAFSKSKLYLYNLTIEQLLSIFKDYKSDSCLYEIYQSTFEAARITKTPHSARVGQLAQNLTKESLNSENEDLHKLKHTFLESVISFNYKHLLEFYLEKLQNPKKIEELFLSLLLSLVFVEQFLGYLFNITQPYYKEVSTSRDIIVDFVSHCFTSSSKDLRSYLEAHLKTDTPLLAEKAVVTWKAQTNDFMDGFYFKNNHDENLQNILSQVFLGPKNFDMTFFVLLLFSQFKIIKVSQIESWAPSFTIKLNKIIGEKIFDAGSKESLYYFIQKTQHDPVKLKKTIGCLIEYFIESAKFFPIHCLSNLEESEQSIEHFFLSKICAFGLGPFEFKLDQVSA